MLTSVPIGPKIDGETQVHRSVLSPDKLVTEPSNDIHTLYDVFQDCVRTSKTKNAFGFRKIDKIIEEEKEVTKIVGGESIKEKKTWKYFQLSGYEYLNFSQANEIVKNIGAGLVKLGLNKNAKLALYTFTNINWMLVSHGCYTQSITITTAYDTLGEENIIFSMNETEVKAIFTHSSLLPTLKKVAGDIHSLEHVIYDGDLEESDLKKFTDAHPEIKLITLEELKQLGKENPLEDNPPKSQDLCCIMYTSGSTGRPKGVKITHANVVSAIAGAKVKFGPFVVPDDTYLAYLPFAHILEFVIENAFMYLGMTIGYGTPKTLSTASVRNCLGDIQELKPSIMGGVPAVFEMIKKVFFSHRMTDILTKINAASMPKQRMFYGAFNAKKFMKNYGLPAGIFDMLIFKKVKQQFGGRLRLIFSGGAPIFTETHEFLSTVLCPMMVGYGLTETSSSATLLPPSEISRDTWGIIGSLLPSIEMKLVDAPESGYLSSNKPNPQGEIWLRGGPVSPGYYKNEKLTKESFTEDGWFKTGDIGEFLKSGSVSIIDRKKNLVKMAHGEYIAIEKLESVYKSTMFVGNVCIFADSFQARPVAAILPVEARVLDLAKDMRIEGGFEELCKNAEIKKAILTACNEQGKRANFKPVEFLADIILLPDEWTPENGLLTAANKIVRIEIKKKYEEQIKLLYAANTPK
ncbi:8446_t:CDS:2 [Diversispora eburnea]|uniref:8446_t:CDS:1 n=1 Tax=Diversispora eburnea TaxID=1213867 RepID=A0A9N9B8L3_9GLOM|nr:8446_t:CDS:2 [Diversispora eburnea]